jgi:DNA-binding CsgD family transcriptional regulator
MNDKNLKPKTFNTSLVNINTYQNSVESLARICGALIANAEKKVDLRKVTQTLAETLDGDGVDIHLRTITGDYFVSCASFGDHFGQMSRGESLVSIRTGRLAEMVETGEPLIMNFQAPNKRDRTSRLAITLGYISAVTTPIYAGELVIGSYSISKKKPWNPNSREIDYLLLIGRILGVGIQNATAAQQSPQPQMPENLNENDKRLLILISQGLSNEEISTELYLSAPSVKRQMKALLQKLGLETRAQAAVFAAHVGLA